MTGAGIVVPCGPFRSFAGALKGRVYGELSGLINTPSIIPAIQWGNLDFTPIGSTVKLLPATGVTAWTVQQYYGFDVTNPWQVLDRHGVHDDGARKRRPLDGRAAGWGWDRGAWVWESRTGFAGFGSLPGWGRALGFTLIPAPVSVELGAFDTSRDLIYQSSGPVTDVSVAFGTGYWGAVYREKHRYAVYADPDRYTHTQRWDLGTGSWVLEYTGSVLGNVNREDSTRPTAAWPALARNGGGAVTTPPRWVTVYAGADQQVVIIEAKGSVTSDGPVLGFREFEVPPSVKRGKISQPVVAVGNTGGVYVAWAEDPDGNGSGRVVIRWLYSGDPFSWDAADVEAVDDPGGACTLPSLAVSGTGVVMLIWRFEDDDGARFIHGIVGSEDPDVAWGAYALATASVFELTTSGSDRDPCVWANAVGQFWCAWINYDPFGDWAAVQVVTTSNGLDSFADAAPVYVTDPVRGAFANFPNGAATDTHAVLTWEVGRAAGEPTNRRIGMAALETTDPDRWSTPDLNVLGFPDGEDVQGHYPSVSVYDWGAATFVQLFWMRGQSSDTTADYYEPASLHLIEGTVVQAERVIHGAPTR